MYYWEEAVMIGIAAECRLKSIVVERFAPNHLVRLLLFIQQDFETPQLVLHVRVDLQIPGYDLFHLAHVVIHVLVFASRGLDTGNDLSFLSQQLGCLFQVLQMVLLQAFVLVKDAIHLFVESEKILVYHLGTLTCVEGLL